MRIFSAIYLPKLFHQVEPSGLAFFLPPDQSSGSTRWVTPPSFTGLHSMGHATKFCRNPDAVHCQSPGYKIRQSNQTKLPPHQPIASDGECPRATSVLPTSLIVESNRHQGAVLCCVQRAVHLGLVTEVPRAQCLRFEEESRPPNASTILGWFCSIGLCQLQGSIE